MDDLHYQAPRLNATCIVVSLLLITVYVYWTLQDTERLQLEVDRERRRRSALERDLRKSERQMDAALEKIHELNGDDDEQPDDEPEQPAGE